MTSPIERACWKEPIREAEKKLRRLTGSGHPSPDHPRDCRAMSPTPSLGNNWLGLDNCRTDSILNTDGGYSIRRVRVDCIEIDDHRQGILCRVKPEHTGAYQPTLIQETNGIGTTTSPLNKLHRWQVWERSPRLQSNHLVCDIGIQTHLTAMPPQSLFVPVSAPDPIPDSVPTTKTGRTAIPPQSLSVPVSAPDPIPDSVPIIQTGRTDIPPRCQSVPVPDLYPAPTTQTGLTATPPRSHSVPVSAPDPVPIMMFSSQSESEPASAQQGALHQELLRTHQQDVPDGWSPPPALSTDESSEFSPSCSDQMRVVGDEINGVSSQRRVVGAEQQTARGRIVSCVVTFLDGLASLYLHQYRCVRTA